MNLPTQSSAGAAATYWFVAVGSERKGPFSVVQLQAMIDQGAVTRTTLAWCSGMQAWATAESTALALLFDTPPNPPGHIDVTTPAIEHHVFTSNVSPVPSAARLAVQAAVPPVAPAASPAREIIGESVWSSKPCPGARYWARMIDIACGGAVLGLTHGWIIPPQLLGNAIFAGVASTFLTMLIEPVLLSTWGWTPGKSLLCVRIRGAGGVLMSTSEGYLRSWAVALRGMGFGIPIVTFITNIVGYNRLTKHGITTWDEQGQFTVTHRNPGWVRGTIAVFIVVACLAASAYLK